MLGSICLSLVARRKNKLRCTMKRCAAARYVCCSLLAVCWLADELLAEGDLLRMLLRGAAVPHAAFMLPCCTALCLCLAARVRPIVCVYVLKAEVENSQSGQSESLRLLFEFDEEDLYSKMTTSSSPGARRARN